MPPKKRAKKKILLEDDKDALLGGGEEEEEEEDVDLPTASKPVKAEAAADESASQEAENGDAKADDKSSRWGAAPPSDAPPDATVHLSPLLLPTSLPPMAPSPFQHHNSGPTSDRLRNALGRIEANPDSDAEAWQALVTEAQSCYRSLMPSLYKLKAPPGGKADPRNESEVDLIGRKLDWIEACYGALLHHFPYSVAHYVQLVEILLRLSALTQDEEEQCGPSSGGALVSLMMGTTAGAGGSALSNPTLTTPDQGVAISPAGLLMNAAMARSGTERQRRCDAKLDRIFQRTLGVTLDGAAALHGDIAASDRIDLEGAAVVDGARTVVGGMAQHSVDLWLLYFRRRYWDAARAVCQEVSIPPPPPGFTQNVQQQGSVLHQQYEESLRAAYRERKDKIREKVTAAYETSLDRGAGFAANNHLIWKRFANYVKSWTLPVNYTNAALSLIPWLPPGTDPTVASSTLPPTDPAHAHTTAQKQLALLRSVYQRGISHPMTGLDQFWQEYEAFERSHSESLASVLIAEWLPRYQHARSIYLERNRVWTLAELKVVGRLAVPPVGYEGSGASQGGMSGLSTRGAAGPASGLSADDDMEGGAGAGGMPGKPTSDAELQTLMEEERAILSKWRRRAAYERTNPERLSASDHAARVRASYAEEVCVFARHPEVWHEWSAWELLHGSSTDGPAGGSDSAASAALIEPATAGEWNSGGNALRAAAVLGLGMESLPDCALLAQAQAEILERYLASAKDAEGGVHGCVKVLERFVDRSPTTLGFVLLQRLVRRHQGIAAARAVFARARRTLRVKEEDASFDADGKEASAAAAETKGADEQGEAKEGEAVKGAASEQRMVTNRLKATVGATTGAQADDAGETANAGFITWHLYASHATIEHRLSHSPRVAARIYELGLRRHRTFLSNPPYVLHYASLLLELNDEENLRSLLTRAVAACEEEDTSGDAAAIAKKREMQRPLWDMMLKFESVLSSRSANGGNISADVHAIEARRRKALYGPSHEDVVMGGEGSPEDEEANLGSGAHKSSLNEQLVRAEGYDVASRIANGMGRMVDVLTVTGAIGNGESDTSSLDFAGAAATALAAGGSSSDMWGDECAGGPSDVCYVKRLKFQRESRMQAAAAAMGLGSGQGLQFFSGTGKLLSARDRTAAAAGQGAGAGAMALQNAPEWLRPLLMLLPPVPKFGRATVKPPPHLTEMALQSMRSAALPATRPASTNGNRKRGRNDGDSSDEENGNVGGGGYGDQFRARQKSRLVGMS
ncbi:hypothetical protein ACHAXT_010133 [Thalassiosira profunda]